MSKFRNGLMKRVMAVILSGAMVMSNMTAYAAEVSYTAEEEYSETVVGDDEQQAEETVNKEAGNSDDEGNAGETGESTLDASEDKADVKEPENEAENKSEEEIKPEEDADNASEAEKEPENETKADDAAAEEATDADEADEETDEKASDVIAEETEVSDEGTTQDATQEATEEEMTEVFDDNTAVVGGNPVDLSGGLKAGTEYGDEILTFTVFEDMTPTARSLTVDGVTYSTRARGTNDPKSSDDKSISATNPVPAKGAAFQINAIKDAKITFVLEEAADKTYYFSKDGGELIDSGLVAKSDTYTFKMLAGNTYYFCVGGSKASVYDISWVERDLADEANRPDWATFAKPVVTASLDSADKTKVNATVDTIIGSKGADKIEVTMYDKDGKEVASAASEKEREKPTTFEFYPDASGSYTFKAVISRTDEETPVQGDMSEAVNFTLPLTVPVMKSATSLGGGQIQVKWGAVAEAEKYVVEYAGAEPVESTASSVVIKGLTVGQKYSFTVYAVRGEEKTAKSKAIECTATENMELNWSKSAYGNGMKPGGVRFEEITKGKEVRLRTDKSSTSSTGKIVPASHDGLGFYYTSLDPTTTNFTFTARAHVNSWTYSNGQEGFGVMVADSVAADGTTAAFWNNSYQAVVSRISYKWNGSEITTDGSGESIDMQIGVGSTAKTGVTPSDVKALAVGEITAPLKFVAEQTSIDTTFGKYGKGQYNLVGNCTNPPSGSDHEQYVNFELQVQKNNTGYFVSYTRLNDAGEYVLDSNGNKITTVAKYYDPNALNVLENDTIYVGVFVSRDADVTFSNMDLQLSDPATDPPAEQKPPKYLNLSTSVASGGIANSSDYTFIFSSNWNGQLVVKDNTGKILSRHTEKDKDGKDVELDYYNVVGTLDPEKSVLLDGDDDRNTKVYIDLKDILLVGKNVFTVEYTPDRNWSPEVEAETGRKIVELKNYDKVTLTHTVEYRKYGEQGQTIYVSQNGKATNTGTQTSPLDIYTAVKYAQPGQTILLAGGRYSLTATLQIARGISGEPDIVDGKETYNKYIKMMAQDPENRPVLDFNSLVAAMVTVGDYWYFKNFDVIRCKDGEKGIQVSGSYCVFDRVDTYKNGSTGLQICRAGGTDTYQDWPHDNLILNCNSYLNVDQGYEDADGFAAKLTSGSNNVFDGCIAAFNADDGWDLFAKAQTGSIGAVVVKNSIAYRNGYVVEENGEYGKYNETGVLRMGKGNGNGFKMGGDGLPTGSKYDSDYNPNGVIPNSGHKLINSLSFYNKSKGFDSNSAPNIKGYNSISYNNGGSNINFSTYAQNQSTDYELRNVISFRDTAGGADSIGTKGKQDISKVTNNTTYKWDPNTNAAVNANGDKITKDSFVSLEYKSLDYIDKDYWRNEDGTINTHGFLQLKEGAMSPDPDLGEIPSTIPSIGGTPSNSPAVGEDTDGSITGGSTEDSGNRYDEDYPDGGITQNYYGTIWVADINYVDYVNKEPIYYTGKKVEPEVHVYFSADFETPLVKGKAYSLKWENNTKAGTAKVIVSGSNHYAGFKAEKEFIIKQVDINDNSVSIPSSVAAADGVDPVTLVKPTWQSKALKKDVDYTIETKDGKIIVTGIGNFTGTKQITPYTVDASKLLNKANITITDKNIVYTGSEVKPACTVKLGGSDLTSGYTVEYANNIKIGKATLTVVGDGVNYFGSKSINFNIKGGKISDTSIVTIDKGATLTKYETEGFTYDGTTGSIPENTIKLSLTKNPDVKLVNGVDYQIIQKGTDKAGSATVTIKGINGYTGAVTYKYTVNPLDISSANGLTALYASTRPFMIGGVVYTPGSDFNLTYNNHVIDSSNYKLTYKDNLMAGEAKVTIVGQKLLKGSKTYDFTITRASMQEYSELFSITAREIATNGKDLYCSDLKKANVIPTQLVGKKAKKLLAGRDFDKKNGIEYYIDINENYEIDAADKKIEDVNAKTKIEEFTADKGYLIILVRVNALTSNPKCSFDGHVDGWFRVGLYNVSKVKVKIKKPRVFGKNYQLGNGQSQPMVWDTEIAKIDDYLDILYGTDTTPMKCVDLVGNYSFDRSILKETGFAIVANSYKKNDRVGTASFTIQGTGKYVGTKKIPFTIVSKNTAEKMGIWEEEQNK